MSVFEKYELILSKWQRQHVEMNSSSRIQKYTLVITLLETDGLKNQKFKVNFNYTQSSNPGWATQDSGLKQK